MRCAVLNKAKITGRMVLVVVQLALAYCMARGGVDVAFFYQRF
jgi:hypothetical protein